MEENNKLIAEFMDVETHNKRLFFLPQFGELQLDQYGCETVYHFNTSELKYHSSWDWLMPVVEKIFISDNYKYRNEDVFRNIEDSLLIPDKVKIYKSVVEFIKWYNVNKG